MQGFIIYEIINSKAFVHLVLVWFPGEIYNFLHYSGCTIREPKQHAGISQLKQGTLADEVQMMESYVKQLWANKTDFLFLSRAEQNVPGIWASQTQWHPDGGKCQIAGALCLELILQPNLTPTEIGCERDEVTLRLPFWMSQTQNATICHSVNLVKAAHTNLSRLFSSLPSTESVPDFQILMTGFECDEL